MKPTKVIFARTRHEYPSYTDFWSLVECAGFRVIFVDQIQLDKNAVYVTTPWNGETPAALRAAQFDAGARTTAKVIWWNLERPDTATKTFAEILDGVTGLADQIWVSDAAYATMDPRLRLVPFGSHPDLGGRILNARPLYDVAPYSYLWGRRQNMIAALERRGMRIAPPAWTDLERMRTLSASRLMLSLHQYPQPPRVIAPIRCAVAAAYRLPFVTEELDGAPAPLVRERDYVHVTPDNVADVVGDLLRDHNRMDELSWSLYRKLCIEYPFDECVQEAVAA